MYALTEQAYLKLPWKCFYHQTQVRTCVDEFGNILNLICITGELSVLGLVMQYKYLSIQNCAVLTSLCQAGAHTHTSTFSNDTRNTTVSQRIQLCENISHQPSVEFVNNTKRLPLALCNLLIGIKLKREK